MAAQSAPIARLSLSDREQKILGFSVKHYHGYAAASCNPALPSMMRPVDICINCEDYSYSTRFVKYNSVVSLKYQPELLRAQNGDDEYPITLREQCGPRVGRLSNTARALLDLPRGRGSKVFEERTQSGPELEYHHRFDY